MSNIYALQLLLRKKSIAEKAAAFVEIRILLRQGSCQDDLIARSTTVYVRSGGTRIFRGIPPVHRL